MAVHLTGVLATVHVFVFQAHHLGVVLVDVLAEIRVLVFHQHCVLIHAHHILLIVVVLIHIGLREPLSILF